MIDKDLCISLSAISFIAGMWLMLVMVDHFDYMISKRYWKCSNASIIDDDPSNTECNVYKKKEKMND